MVVIPPWRGAVRAGLVLAAQALSACGSSTPYQIKAGTNAMPAVHAANCLEEIWSAQPASDRNFDAQHDGSGDQSISCNGFTTASALQRSIDALRAAVRRHDEARIVDLVSYPFAFIDGRGGRSLIRSPEDLRRRFGAVFTPETYAAIERMDLSAVTLVRSRGMFFELGGLWLSVTAAGRDPQLIAINHAALAEAKRRGNG